MAGFNVCPMGRDTQRLFKSRPDLLMRPRIPIAERAKALRNRIWETTTSVTFEIAAESRKKDIPEINAVMRNLKPLFKNAFVFISEMLDRDGNHVVSAKCFELDDFKTAPDPKSEDYSLRVEIKFHKALNEMELMGIKSNKPGLGGDGVAAVYNIAKDLGVESIYYYVGPRKTNAKRFYYHTDFGRADSDGRERMPNGISRVDVK